jgi:glutaminyl-tRNA synthetase
MSCRAEPNLKGVAPFSHFQLERLGSFCVDPDTTKARLVFNRTVPLRDTWARIKEAGRG